MGFLSFLSSFQRIELFLSFLLYDDQKRIVPILLSLCKRVKKERLLDNDFYLFLFRHFSRCETCFQEEKYFNRCCRRDWRDTFSTLINNLHLRSQYNYKFSTRIMHKDIISDDARKQLYWENSVVKMLDHFLVVEHYVLRSLFNDAVLHKHAVTPEEMNIKFYRVSPWVRVRPPKICASDKSVGVIKELYRLFISATGSTSTNFNRAIEQMANEQKAFWYVTTISTVAENKNRKIVAIVAPVHRNHDEAFCRVSAIAIMRSRFEVQVLELILCNNELPGP